MHSFFSKPHPLELYSTLAGWRWILETFSFYYSLIFKRFLCNIWRSNWPILNLSNGIVHIFLDMNPPKLCRPIAKEELYICRLPMITSNQYFCKSKNAAFDLLFVLHVFYERFGEFNIVSLFEFVFCSVTLLFNNKSAAFASWWLMMVVTAESLWSWSLCLWGFFNLCLVVMYLYVRLAVL